MNSVIHGLLCQSHSQTGRSWWLLEWPTGTYASGSPSYEKPEAA